MCYFLIIRPKVKIKKGIGPEPDREKLAQEKLLKRAALSFQPQTAGFHLSHTALELIGLAGFL